MEVLLEFKVQRENKKTIRAQEPISQIFQNQYYKNFKTEKSQEKIMIGIVMDARDSKVIKEYEVLKYKGDGDIGDRSNWMRI
jgi:hypothetical protein